MRLKNIINFFASLFIPESDGSYMLQVTKSPAQKPEVPEKRITHITMMNDVEGVFVLGKGKQEKQEAKIIERQVSTKEMQKVEILKFCTKKFWYCFLKICFMKFFPSSTDKIPGKCRRCSIVYVCSLVSNF